MPHDCKIQKLYDTVGLVLLTASVIACESLQFLASTGNKEALAPIAPMVESKLPASTPNVSLKQFRLEVWQRPLDFEIHLRDTSFGHGFQTQVECVEHSRTTINAHDTQRNIRTSPKGHRIIRFKDNVKAIRNRCLGGDTTNCQPWGSPQQATKRDEAPLESMD